MRGYWLFLLFILFCLKGQLSTPPCHGNPLNAKRCVSTSRRRPANADRTDFKWEWLRAADAGLEGPPGPRGFLGSRAAAEPTLGPAGFSCAAIDLQLEEPRHRPQVLDDSYPPCGSPLPGAWRRLCPKGALHPQSDRTTPASPRRPTPTGCPECLLFLSRVTPTGVARALRPRRATQAAGPAGGAGLQGRGRCAPGRGASRSGQRGPARKGFTTLPKQRWKAPWDAHPHTAGGSLLRRLPTCHRILHGRLSGAETATL